MIVLYGINNLCNKCSFAWFSGENRFKCQSCESTPPLTGLQNEGFHIHSLLGALTETLQTITTDAPVQARRGGWFHCLMLAPQSKTDHYVHSARSKVGLGSQSLVCNTLIQARSPSFYSVLILTFDNDFKNMGKIHHLGEHFHDVRMLSGSTDELLECQLTWCHKQKKKTSKSDWKNKTYSRRNVGAEPRLFTFSIDIYLVIYKSNNLLWRDFVCSGDILNSLTEGV